MSFSFQRETNVRIIYFLEDILEPAIILLQNRILRRHELIGH